MIGALLELDWHPTSSRRATLRDAIKNGRIMRAPCAIEPISAWTRHSGDPSVTTITHKTVDMADVASWRHRGRGVAKLFLQRSQAFSVDLRAVSGVPCRRVGGVSGNRHWSAAASATHFLRQGELLLPALATALSDRQSLAQLRDFLRRLGEEVLACLEVKPAPGPAACRACRRRPRCWKSPSPSTG